MIFKALYLSYPHDRNRSVAVEFMSMKYTLKVDRDTGFEYEEISFIVDELKKILSSFFQEKYYGDGIVEVRHTLLMYGYLGDDEVAEKSKLFRKEGILLISSKFDNIKELVNCSNKEKREQIVLKVKESGERIYSMKRLPIDFNKDAFIRDIEIVF